VAKRPSLKDQNIGVFFGAGAKKEVGAGKVSPKAEETKKEVRPEPQPKPKPQNSRTVEQKKPKLALATSSGQSRKIRYQEHWKAEGKTQISIWIPTALAQELRIRAAKEGKKLSDIASELLGKK